MKTKHGCCVDQACSHAPVVVDFYTENDIRAIVDSKLEARTQKELAEELGVSKGYLNDYLHFRREPGVKLLDGLGMQRVVMYRRVAEKKEPT